MNTRSSSRNTDGGVIISTGVDGALRMMRARLLPRSWDGETSDVIEILAALPGPELLECAFFF
jgi:hypothetical protein